MFLTTRSDSRWTPRHLESSIHARGHIGTSKWVDSHRLLYAREHSETALLFSPPPRCRAKIASVPPWKPGGSCVNKSRRGTWKRCAAGPQRNGAQNTVRI